MTRSENIQAILNEYAQRRQQNEDALKQRVRAASEKDLMIQTLMETRATLALQAVKRAMSDKAHAKEIASDMRARGLAINAEIRQRLKNIGFPEDSLQLHYTCPLCRDTGYVGDAPARLCACVEKRLREQARAEDAFAPYERECFENYNDLRIPDENIEGEEYTQRTLTRTIRDHCEKYANRYPNTDKPNLVLIGDSGLGKTFLLNCIASRVEARGYAATRVSAYRMFEAMREAHFHTEDSNGAFERLINCELLLIDDLGTEPMFRNITSEYLFILLNDRLARRRHTVVTTNLLPGSIAERYGKRVMSRLVDMESNDTFQMRGKDLRRL